MIAIGNEVLLREDIEVEELIDYIKQVKKTVPHIPVGYVDAYYMYVNYPRLLMHVMFYLQIVILFGKANQYLKRLKMLYLDIITLNHCTLIKR